jgi:hypothetical protein
MARLRNKNFRESADGPVTSPPTAGAELPPVAAEKPVEPPAVENAVKQAHSCHCGRHDYRSMSRLSLSLLLPFLVGLALLPLVSLAAALLR